MTNIDPNLTETRTITITLFGTEETDFEQVLSEVEAALDHYDGGTGTLLDWNIEREG